jgi:hypothetical protein
LALEKFVNLQLFGTKFRNAEMADEYECARVGGLTGFELKTYSEI